MFEEVIEDRKHHPLQTRSGYDYRISLNRVFGRYENDALHPALEARVFVYEALREGRQSRQVEGRTHNVDPQRTVSSEMLAGKRATYVLVRVDRPVIEPDGPDGCRSCRS